MEDKYTTYISKYNDIETKICKIDGAPIDANMKWFEDSLEDIKLRNKLYLCRIVRNYIQHNSDYKDFISITDNMLNFLDSIDIMVNSKLNTAENIMIPLKKIQYRKINDNIFDTISFMNLKNIDYIPIIDDEYKVIGIFSISSVLNLISNDFLKKTSKFKDLDFKKYLNINKDTVKFINKDKLLEDIFEIFISSKGNKNPTKLIIITSTGNSKGNVLGIITEYDIYNL